MVNKHDLGAFYCVKATFAINRNILKVVLTCVAASHGNHSTVVRC